MKSSLKMTLVLLFGLYVLAGGIRLYRLGVMDTRGDEVVLLLPPRATSGPMENFIYDWRDFKTGRVLCIPRMAASAVIKGFHLPPTRFSLRLTYCLMGILTIPALFMLGIRLGDRRLAWILAFLGTINPYLIFYSREAHVYAFPLLFNTLAAACAAGIVASLRKSERPCASDVIWFCTASILACHSHMSSWPFIGLLWMLVWLMLWAQRRVPVVWGAVRGVGIAFGLWIMALLPWICIFISALFTAHGSFLQGGGVHVFGAMWRLPFVMMWGGGWPWVVVTVVLLLAGMLGGLVSARWRAVVSVMMIISVIVFGIMSAMILMGGGFFNLRYYTPLWLIFNLLGGLGVLLLAEWIAARVQAAGWETLQAGHVAAGLCGVVTVFMALPIYWLLHLPGNPSPYSMVNRWMDANLPKGTLVIVDRWFEPWNEMRYHAPTNVIATFTVPTEPYDVMMKFNWAQTVKDFYKSFPDSAYMELVKASPVLGETWEWPRRHFRRHVAFTNEPGLALRRAMLAPEESYYYANDIRIVVGLFYNTREDAVEQARATGQKTFVCYGPGWGYVKLWQQLRDFRDWRVLDDKATLDLYNLTAGTNTVSLMIRGMAANGAKRVRFGMVSQADFKNLELAEWRIASLVLKPGLNQFVLTDELWSLARIPLLVDQVEVVTAAQ